MGCLLKNTVVKCVKCIMSQKVCSQLPGGLLREKGAGFYHLRLQLCPEYPWKWQDANTQLKLTALKHKLLLQALFLISIKSINCHLHSKLIIVIPLVNHMAYRWFIRSCFLVYNRLVNWEKKIIIRVMSRNVANKNKNADMHKLHFFKYSVVTGSENKSNPHRIPCLNLD